MTFRPIAPICALMALCVPGLALGQDRGFETVVSRPPAGASAQSSAGTCIIMRGDKLLDRQNCKAIAAGDGASGAFANSITYVWPSGNKTVVGGSEEDFSVNGNLAVPLPDQSRGLCLKVEKTGNTFCYEDGAKVKPAAQVAANKPAADKPAPEKKAETTAVTGEATTTAAVEGASTLAEQLAQETKLRKAAEEELAALKTDMARLNEAEEKRLAEVAAQQKADDEKRKNEAEEKSAADKTRMEAVLKELDGMRARCKSMDAAACDKAIALLNEAAVTGSTGTASLAEIRQLRAIALAPFGIPALSFAAEVPSSTWAASSVAAFLALALLTLSMRHRRDWRQGHYLEPAPPPNLDEPLVESLDPFAAPAQPFPANAPLAMRTTPPPIPAYSKLEDRRPPDEPRAQQASGD